jgi:carboxypeptidase Q
MKVRIFVMLILGLHSVGFGQEKLDTTMVSKLKKLGESESRIMEILSNLTDINGPRLTNSPGFHSAAAYVKKEFSSWELENITDDVWNESFGRGWQLKRFALASLTPTYHPIIAYPKAWSPGIKGTVSASVVFLDVKKEEDLLKYKGTLKNKIVLFSHPALISPAFKPDAWRHTDSSLLQLANSLASAPYRRMPPITESQRLAYQKWSLCEKEGVLAVLEITPSARYDGTVSVADATVPYPAEVPYANRLRAYHPKAPKVLPQIVVAGESYNRMVRQLKAGVDVKLELTLSTEFLAEAPGYNVIAEIPGTDLRDEIVMIGAHLDSWHAGTGTTDNACGAAVMMEAIRLIKASGVSPRRTIRIALWGGEEQGLLGSRNYVKRIFGERMDNYYPYDSIQLKSAAAKISVYFNMDNGGGKYRGIYLQGNDKVGPIFRAWLRPFEKSGASTLTLKNATGTDHIAFDALGIPGFQFIQDPIEYGTRSYHSNTDVYEKAIESDLKQNAIITAVFAWHAANRDQLLPRKE